MKQKLQALYWKLFGYPDMPPKFQIVVRPNQYTGQLIERRHAKMAALHQAGYSVDEIAIKYNVTRERVRQCVWKAYRESLK